MISSFFILFFFNDTATTEIYTLSLHDALPICACLGDPRGERFLRHVEQALGIGADSADRKSTRLNSSHSQISYAVFCLKKKKETKIRSARTGREHVVIQSLQSNPREPPVAFNS